jgi:predicted secreted protein
MSLLSSVAIFFVIWWLVLFAVLPFGVKSQHEMNDVTLGTEHGAPHEPRLLRKAIATTLVAAVIFAFVYLYFGIWHKSLEDLMP